MAESQLVTVAGINKVWSATMALYNKLDHRLDNIGKLYTPKGTVAAFDNPSADSDLLSKTGVKVGDTWVVSDGYPAFTGDPENFPDSTSYSGDVPPRPFICIKEYNGKTSIQSGETWEDYWNPINLNLNIASDDNYGVVRLLSADKNHNDRRIQGADGLYVNVPDANDERTLTGLVKPGRGININNGEISLDKDLGIDITGSENSQKIKNIGIRAIDNGKSGDANVNLSDGEIEITTPAAGTLRFTKKGTSDKFQFTIAGWHGPDWDNVKSSAVRSTSTETKGSNKCPVYVGADREVDVITSLLLGDSSTTTNVATFTSATSGNSANTVEITGPGNVDNDPKTTDYKALKVTGSAYITQALSATKVYHAVWNDISDAIEVQDTLKTDPGYCYFFDGKEYHRTDKYCQKGIIGIHSDTAGSVLGRKGKHKELDISVGGFVLAYVDKEYAPGTPLTSAPNGRLTKMSLISRILHPERLVATYWKRETNKEWGDETHKVEVDGRHWVKVR